MKYSEQDRKDMSMGTRDYDKGLEKGMKMGRMGHASEPKKLKTVPMCDYEKGRMSNRGYDEKAYDYKY